MSEEKRLTLEEALKITPFGTERKDLTWHTDLDDYVYDCYGSVIDYLRYYYRHTYTYEQITKSIREGVITVYAIQRAA